MISPRDPEQPADPPGRSRQERGRTWIRAVLDFFLRQGACLECRGTGVGQGGHACPRCGGRGR